MAISYLSIERYGMLILIVLLATGILGPVLSPLLRGSYHLILNLFGIL